MNCRSTPKGLPARAPACTAFGLVYPVISAITHWSLLHDHWSRVPLLICHYSMDSHDAEFWARAGTELQSRSLPNCRAPYKQQHRKLQGSQGTHSAFACTVFGWSRHFSRHTHTKATGRALHTVHHNRNLDGSEKAPHPQQM